MSDAGIVRLEMVSNLLQLAIIIVLMYHSLARSKIDSQKKLFFLAFASYGLFLILHLYNRAAQAEFVVQEYKEVSALSAHVFKTMFFLIFGYAILDALIIEESLKRILKSNAMAAFLMLFLFSTGIVLIEGPALLFNDTGKELIFELVEMTIQVMIINIAYHSWKDTESKNLLMIAGVFTLFYAANISHVSGMLWGFFSIEYVVRHTLRLSALVFLAYALIFYRAK